MISGPSPSRARRYAWVAGLALVLFAVTGFFIAPPIVKSQLEKRGSAALGRTVTVGKVRVNPFALSVTLEDFDVRTADAKSSFAGWQRLYVNFDALASLTGDWVLSEVELDGLHAAVAVRPDGALSFADILTHFGAAFPAPAAPAKPGRPLRVGSLRVNGARVDFTDRSRPKPFATVIGPLTFVLTNFRTAGAAGAPYHFEAVTESGEKLTWRGTLAADPVSSAGELSLENIILAKYAPYYADRIHATIVDGKIAVHGHYELNLGAGSRAMKFIDGAVQVRGLKIADRADGDPAVDLPALAVTGINADALAMKAAVTSVNVTGGQLRARREADGTINLLAMFLPPADVLGPPTATPVAARPPEFTLGELAVKDFAVDLTDLAAPRPAHLGLGAIQWSVKNVSLADGAAMPVDLAFTWVPQGTVHVAGSMSIQPELKADLKTEVTGLAILPLSPYLEQFVNARITQGAVTSEGSVGVTLAAGVPAITFDGGVTLDNFGLVDAAHNEELAGVASLVLSGLKLATVPPLTVSLEAVSVMAPYARVRVNPDKSLNLATVMKTASAPPTAPGPVVAPPVNPPWPAAPPRIAVGKVVISGGDFSLSDRSVEPNVRMAVNQFSGTITGLSSENLARADVDLNAVVDGSGPVTIRGKLDPLGAKKFVDLVVTGKNVDLLPLSPYSGKFAGYELARGQLQLDVKVKLEGQALDASNVITLHQFTFGAPVSSPDATKLPVRLGVALLKDTSGQIVIDVPMSGSIDDPSLRIGKVVLRVVGNLLTKAATSPFALLGSMFGGGGEELAFQEFAPGESALLPADRPKLATMVKALTNRPGLSLALEGGFDGPADTFALRRAKLAALVRGRIWEEMHAADPNIAPPEKLELTTEANAAMVKRLYNEKFPPGTEFGVPVAPAPVAAPPPPHPKKGLFGRVVDVVTLKGLRKGEAKPAGPAATTPVPEAAPADVTTTPAGPTLEGMTGRLAETMAVTDDDLRALAAARAQTVRDYFVTEGKIPADRLFLSQGQEAGKANQGPRVWLSLQ